jgi:hypothetical protein
MRCFDGKFRLPAGVSFRLLVKVTLEAHALCNPERRDDAALDLFPAFPGPDRKPSGIPGATGRD